MYKLCCVKQAQKVAAVDCFAAKSGSLLRYLEERVKLVLLEYIGINVQFSVITTDNKKSKCSYDSH